MLISDAQHTERGIASMTKTNFVPSSPCPNIFKHPLLFSIPLGSCDVIYSITHSALVEEIQQLLKYDLVNFREPFVMVWDDCHWDLAKACRV